MGIIEVKSVLNHDSGLPEDKSINVLHFNGDATDAIAAELVNAIVSFWETTTGQTASICSRLSPILSGGHEMYFYDLDEPSPRTPYYVGTNLFTALSASPLPSEVAVVNSYSAHPVSGLNQRRRRGRMFIGPLGSGATVMDTTSGKATVASSFRTDLGTATDRLCDLATAAGAPFVVYSRVNDSAAVVDGGYVDNAFDTMRSRGEAATTRTGWGWVVA